MTYLVIYRTYLVWFTWRTLCDLHEYLVWFTWRTLCFRCAYYYNAFSCFSWYTWRILCDIHDVPCVIYMTYLAWFKWRTLCFRCRAYYYNVFSWYTPTLYSSDMEKRTCTLNMQRSNVSRSAVSENKTMSYYCRWYNTFSESSHVHARSRFLYHEAASFDIIRRSSGSEPIMAATVPASLCSKRPKYFSHDRIAKQW